MSKITDICAVCGYRRGLHEFETRHCPKNGEAAPGCDQEFLDTTFVPKLETPEACAQSIKDSAFDPWCWNQEEKQYTGYFDLEEATSQIAARDAQYLALLKTCGEALGKARGDISCPAGKRANFLAIEATLSIDAALAALREARVLKC